MINRLIFVTGLAISSSAFSSDLDVLMARTALALGDEYAKLASNYQNSMTSYMKTNPTVDMEDLDDAPEEYKNFKQKYSHFLNLAQDEYEIVLCNRNCPSPLPSTGLSMPNSYNYIRREAFTKFDQLARGVNTYGIVGKYADIYAVNSNFEEHLLGKLTKLVEIQQRLDKEARGLNNTLIQLQNSYVDLDTEQIVGVDQAILNSQNYSLDTQTQVASYQACVANETLEDNFERDEITKSVAQLSVLKKNLNGHFEKAFDYVYENPAGEKIFTVFANQYWQIADTTFAPLDHVLITATGLWNTKGSVLLFQPGHLYMDHVGPSRNKGFFADAWKSVSTGVNDFVNWTTNELVGPLIAVNPRVLKALEQSNKPAFNRIVQGLETKPEGYLFSFSEGLSNGVSDGSGNSLGFFFGTSSSAGSSTGQSVGTGGTYSIKLTTTIRPEFPLGGLLGSFCDTPPALDPSCIVFFIGSGTMLEVPENLGTKKLWFAANDGGAINENKGSVQVKIQKQQIFKTYWDQYYAWYSSSCDEDGFNCGLGKILENIAYIPDPYTVAKASFIKQFPEFPDAVSNLILQQINYLIEMEIAHKEVKAKEHSRELHATKIASCKDQLAASQEKVNVTRELVETYQRREQNVKIKEILLDTSKGFYESELAAVNRIREKNLERIRRYYALTVNSYNYLYLDDFKVDGESQPYFEGDFYQTQIGLMEDLILEITAVNDLLNPNRGFIVYQLSDEELTGLRNPNYRLRNTQIKLDYNDVFCQGFNLENQARVMIEKVGILLDIDPTKEHLFFKNPNMRNTQVQLTHGLENRFFNFDGAQDEFWMPFQKRNVAGYSTRVLVDSNSDYFQLRDARFFERLSFRKTSFASTWQLVMTDPALKMYEAGDTTFSNPLLKGVKVIFWYNSAELQGDKPLNQCLVPPVNLSAAEGPTTGATLSWDFSKDDGDFAKVQRFSIYRSTNPEHGFKPIAHIDASACSNSTEEISCSYNDEIVSNGQYYYQIRSSYKSSEPLGVFLDGTPSEVASVTLSK